MLAHMELLLPLNPSAPLTRPPRSFPPTNHQRSRPPSEITSTIHRFIELEYHYSSPVLDVSDVVDVGARPRTREISKASRASPPQPSVALPLPPNLPFVSIALRPSGFETTSLGTNTRKNKQDQARRRVFDPFSITPIILLLLTCSVLTDEMFCFDIHSDRHPDLGTAQLLPQRYYVRGLLRKLTTPLQYPTRSSNRLHSSSWCDFHCSRAARRASLSMTISK